MFKISREPAILLGLVAALVQVLSVLVFNWTIDQQAVINAVAVAVAGVVTAILVKADNLAPLLLGLSQAVVALALGFGWELSPDVQVSITAVVATLVAMFVRTAVTAPVDSSGTPVQPPAPAQLPAPTATTAAPVTQSPPVPMSTPQPPDDPPAPVR
jgi:urea transporter